MGTAGEESASHVIARILDEGVSTRIFSGYEFVAARGDRTLELAGGKTSHWPEAVPVDGKTRFDLGSITKTAVTTSLLARALAAGKIRLEDPVARSVSWLAKSPLGALTLFDLLCHASGLVGWFPFYQQTPAGIAGFREWLTSRGATLLKEAPGVKAEYSDPGFLLLGLVAEACCGDLRAAFEEEVARPLGTTTLTYAPLESGVSVAATEWCLWRQRLLTGEVFDENCFHLGGVAGHAGLFGTARDLARIGTEWLRARQGKSAWLPAPLALRFTSPAGRIAGSSWRLGWDGKSGPSSSAGGLFSAASFGGLGYPGASLWIDPEVDGVAVLLTNRVHPSRVDERIRQIRPAVHDAIARAWRAGGE